MIDASFPRMFYFFFVCVWWIFAVCKCVANFLAFGFDRFVPGFLHCSMVYTTFHNISLHVPRFMFLGRSFILSGLLDFRIPFHVFLFSLPRSSGLLVSSGFLIIYM